MKYFWLCVVALFALGSVAAAQVTVSDSVEFKIKNVNSGLVLGISGQSQTAGTSVVQWTDNGTPDHLWHFMPMGNGQYNIENMLTHQVLGISGASKSNGAQVLEWADNGTADHLWTLSTAADGNLMIKNVNSGLFLEIFQANTTTSGVVDQWANTGCKCQEWTLVSTGTSPYPAPLSVSGSGIFVHDPNMIKTSAGTYWLYGTHNTLAESTNRSSWTAQSAGDINPDFSWWHTINTTGTGGRTDIWAPSVMFANNKYYQYYSIPFEPHGGAQALIALATSANPNGPWTDAGQIIESCGTTSGCTTTFNAIDPAPFIDSSGNWWMVFGSWNDGIHVLQLNSTTGLRISSNSPLTTVAVRGTTAVSNGEEGAFIYPHGGMYYYFASINVCCNGVNSTYRTIVGRSSSPTGPYVDKGGLALTNSGGTILLSSHGNINGPGGESILTDGSSSILVYHYYDGNNNGTPTLGLNTITWGSDGWPTIQ